MLRALGLVLLFPAAAMAADFPVSGPYGTDAGCKTFDGRNVQGGLVITPKFLATPETWCSATDAIKTAAGYRAQCPTREPATVTFTLFKQDDGTLAYADDYWGSEVLHRCP